MNAIDAIETLALNAANQAVKAETPLQEKIDALKALSPYYLALAKARANEPSDEEGTIVHLTERIRKAEKAEEHGYDSRDVQDRTRRRGD